MGLNAKQKIFVKEYLVDKNATRAAKAADYSPKSAHSVGPRLLENAEVAKAIAEGLAVQMADAEKRAAKAGLTKDRWLLELKRVAFANMDDFAQIQDVETETWEGSDEKGKFVTNVTQRVVFTSTMERKIGRGHIIKSLSETVTQHGGSIKIELHNKMAALETIGRAYGWIKDQVEMTGADGGAQIHLHIFQNGSEAESEPKE